VPTISGILGMTLPESFDKVDVSVLSNNFNLIDLAFGQRITLEQIANNLETEKEGMVLDARQGKALSDTLVSVAKAIDETKVSKTDIVNDLKTDDGTKPLSAAQGVELNRTKAFGFSASVLLPTEGWTGDGPYTRDIELAGVSENKDICHVVMSFDPAYEEPFTDSGVVLVAQKQDALTFKVEFIPEEAFPVNVLVMFTGQEVDG